MHFKVLFILIAWYQLTEAKPYLNTRRLSFGEQMTWRFGGWKPMVPSSSGLRSEDHLSGLGSLLINSNHNNNNLTSSPVNSNYQNSNSNVPSSSFYNTTSANGVTTPTGSRNVTVGPLTSSNHLRVNQVNGLPSTPSSSSSSSSPPSSLPLLPIPTSGLASHPVSGSLTSPESSESHLNPKYRHVDIEQVKMDDYIGGGPGKGHFPGSPGPMSAAVHGFYGPSMGHSFGKSTFGFPGSLKGGHPFRMPSPGHLSYLGRGLPLPGSHLGPRPNRHEVNGGPPHGKPVKDAELHAYQVIKQLKERGRDIRKDFGIVDAFPVNRGLYPKVTTGEGGKRYVTVPVAIETDHDKVLTQNDIKDIEKEVLKIIPEVEHGLVEGAVKDGARVIELPGGGNGEKGGRSIGRPPITVTSPSVGGGGGGGRHIPGHSSGGVITGPSPIIYDNLAANPIKSRISSIFRPLLSKFRSPNRPQSHPQPYSSSDPKNLNVIHLIAHQDRLPSVVPIDRLVQRPDGSNGPANGQGSRFPGMGHGQPPMANLQYKIIHPPQGQGQPGQQQPFIEYNPHQGPPSGPALGHQPGSQSPDSPPYQVIEVPRGYDHPDHLLESPPQVVPINGEQLVDLKANQYNSGDEPQHHQGPSYGNDQSPTPGSIEIVNRPTESGYSDQQPPSSAYPTTGSPPSNYQATNYDDEEDKHQDPNNYGNPHGQQSGYDNQQQQHQSQQHPGNYGNGDHSGTDYSNPVGPEYNLNGHSGQIERPGKDYPNVGDANNGGGGENVDEDDRGNHGSTLTPSVDYAEAPKIELLNGASPDFNAKPYTNPNELDTKMLINLISNQIPSLGNVLKGEPESNGKGHEEDDRSRNVDPQANYNEQGHQVEGYDRDQSQGISSPPPTYDSNDSPADDHKGDGPQVENYGPSNGPNANGYSQTDSPVNQDQNLRFGDRIRGQEVVYAKAEHYDDQHYQSNSHSSSGLYSESSNSQEVRVKSDNSTKKDGSGHSDSDDGETSVFVKLDRRDKPINGKVIFGHRSKSNETSTDDQVKVGSAQSYHAYSESGDHIPPPGYVKLTTKEFKELFKDAEIHYSKGQSSDPLSPSPSELNQTKSSSTDNEPIIESEIDDQTSNGDEVTTIKPSGGSGDEFEPKIESIASSK